MSRPSTSTEPSLRIRRSASSVRTVACSIRIIAGRSSEELEGLAARRRCGRRGSARDRDDAVQPAEVLARRSRSAGRSGSGRGRGRRPRRRRAGRRTAGGPCRRPWLRYLDAARRRRPSRGCSARRGGPPRRRRRSASPRRPGERARTRRSPRNEPPRMSMTRRSPRGVRPEGDESRRARRGRRTAAGRRAWRMVPRGPCAGKPLRDRAGAVP